MSDYNPDPNIHRYPVGTSGVDPADPAKVICPLCGLSYRRLQMHLYNVHKMAYRDFLVQYPDVPLTAPTTPPDWTERPIGEVLPTVNCKVCGKPFIDLTKHLGVAHGLRIDAYLEEYPDALLRVVDSRRVKPGGKSRLNPRTLELIVGLVRQGNYDSVVAKAVGVNPSTYGYWLDRGKKEKTGIYHDLWIAVQQAEAEAEVSLVEEVRNWVSKDPRVGLELLSRRFGTRWRPAQAVDISADVTTKVASVTEDLIKNPETREMAMNLFRQIVGRKVTGSESQTEG